VALSLVLLVGGGLFGRSLLKAYSANPGFRSANLLTMSFDLPPGQYAGARGTEFVRALTGEMSSIPGAQSATVSRELPLTMVRSTIQTAAESPRGASHLSADYNVVGPAYLQTMGIALMAGRDFTAHDDASSAKVAVVNRTLAERLWGRRNSVGRNMRLEERGGHITQVEVVGVAADAKYNSIWEQPQPYLYLPAAQSGFPGGHLIVRTLGRPEALIPAIRRQWDCLAPRVPLYDVHTGEDDVNLSLAPQRLAAGLLGAFGGLAILLASLGLYSLTAYSVVRRRREIGIRIAIGARPETVVRQILLHALRLAGTGVAIGLAASLALMRFVASQVKDVSPYDAATFAAVALLLLLVSLAAAFAPAVRASRTDPLIALKCE
ncbi:MAG: FtsX-like permease family protein, partial [Bryobacteraceae bacterium]